MVAERRGRAGEPQTALSPLPSRSCPAASWLLSTAVGGVAGVGVGLSAGPRRVVGQAARLDRQRGAALYEVGGAQAGPCAQGHVTVLRGRGRGLTRSWVGVGRLGELGTR